LGKADRHSDELAVDGYQDAMLDVAAVAVAAIESVDRIAYDSAASAVSDEQAEIAALREALAPFANREAERAFGGGVSALTDAQWRRALEAYQECPGGDMCGCKPKAQR
jgi:hypothetical protein